MLISVIKSPVSVMLVHDFRVEEQAGAERGSLAVCKVLAERREEPGMAAHKSLAFSHYRQLPGFESPLRLSVLPCGRASNLLRSPSSRDGCRCIG